MSRCLFVVVDLGDAGRAVIILVEIPRFMEELFQSVESRWPAG